MYNSEGVHVLKHHSCVSGYSHFEFVVEVDLFVDVQQAEEGALAVLEHDVDIRNFRDHAHQNADAGMSKNTLHHYLILNFLQELVCQSGVEDFLDCYRSSIQLAFVDD